MLIFFRHFISPLIICLLMIFYSIIVQSNTEESEEWSLLVAEQAILASLLVHKHPTGRYLCAEVKMACVGPDSQFLGMMLIDKIASLEAKRRMVSLVRFQLDASLASDYDCHILKYGSDVKKDIEEFDVDGAVNMCFKEVTEFISRHGELLKPLKPADICATSDAIKERLLRLEKAILSNITCDSIE